MPGTDEATVRAFASEVVPGAVPLTVFCVPMPGAYECDCFATVEQQIARAGGSQVLGWAIWCASPLIEAEFHAVWQSPSGVWFDLTPRPFEVEWITFVSDLSARYDGSQVDNVRKSLVDDPLADEYIALMRRRFEILNEGDLAGQHGAITLSGERLAEHDFIAKRVSELSGLMSVRYEPPA